MNRRPVRVGVIGVGLMGAAHAAMLDRVTAGAVVTAVSDLDPARAATVADQVGATSFVDVTGLIESELVDAVLIASQDTAHADQVLACLTAGKPVLCEKPLAPTSAECRRIVDAEAAGVPLVSVGFMRRFHPGFVDLRAAVHDRRLGHPLLALSSHRNVEAAPTGGSAETITNSAIHEIDTIAWVLGSPIAEVSWHAPRSTSEDTRRQDPQLLHLRTADGVLSVVDVFVNARYGYDVRCEVVCERGVVQLAPTARIVTDHELRSSRAHPADWRPFFAEAYRIELQAWVDAVAGRQQSPLATALDGLRATLVAEALITSMRTGGRTVAVPSQ